MKHIICGLAAILFAFMCTLAPAATPERVVRDNVVISKADPAITITVPKSATWLGADRWDLYGIADCELHVYVEADIEKNVKALYWIQFEGYLPSNQHTYDYTKDEPVTFAGRPFWKRARFSATPAAPRAGSDFERVQQIVAKAGYKLPAEQMNVRLVHLLDESKRKELMFIYAEDLAPTGYTAAQLLDGKEPRPEWAPLEKALVERAQQRIQLSN